MTVVHPNHITGINSITVATGEALSVHKNDGSLIRTIVSNTGISTFHAIEVSKGGGDLTVGISTLVVDNSAGKIGIGTVPARTFQVFAATPQVNLKSAAGGNCELQFGDTGDEVRANIIYNSTENYLGINGYNNTERLRIGTGGNGSSIGIGTTVNMVTNSEVLTVRGTSSFKSGGNTRPALYLGNEGSTSDTINPLILFNDSGANRGGIGYVPNTGELRFNNQYYITFNTGSGTLGGTERVRIAADGVFQIDQGTSGGNRFKIKNDEISLLAGVNGTGDTYEREAFFGSTRVDSGSYPFIRIAGQGGIKFCADANSERMRITSDGRVRIGASTDEDVHTGEGADLQVVSTDAGGLTFARDDTTVSNGANLGVIRAYGNDNNGTYQEVASIQFQADLNHGTNDKPGRLVFSTTSDGGSSVEERMRITSKGVTERISRQSATRTYEFSYSDTAGGSGQNKNLFTINDDGNSTATLVAVIDTVGLYGAGDTYIHTSQWITGIRRASSDTAWSATTPQEVGANGSGDADLDVSWSGDTLQANASAWMQWTVFVRVTAYNTTITINA